MTQQHLHYVQWLMARESNAVGFIPEPRLRWDAHKGRILIAEQNAEPCGYAIIGSDGPILRVLQIAVQPDARRIEHATTLVRTIEAIAKTRGASMITLRCASDLEANEFWKTIGYHVLEIDRSPRARKRQVNRYCKPIIPPIFA